MKHAVHWGRALALALAVSLLPALPALAQAGKPTAGDTPAAQQARAARQAVAEKQKQIFDEKNIPVETRSDSSTTLIDLPLDEADAPGAVEQ